MYFLLSSPCCVCVGQVIGQFFMRLCIYIYGSLQLYGFLE